MTDQVAPVTPAPDVVAPEAPTPSAPSAPAAPAPAQDPAPAPSAPAAPAAPDAPAAPQDPNSAPKSPGSESPPDGTLAKPTEPPKEAPKVVPEKYDLKLPKGSQLDAKATERIAAYSKAQGLSQIEAQALLDRENEAVSSFATRQSEQIKQTVEGWKVSSQQDPEIGGPLFKENVELAHRVVARYGSPEFTKYIDSSGFGNHPELVRIFARIGRQMREDSLVMPGAQSGEPRSTEDILYPKTTQQQQ